MEEPVTLPPPPLDPTLLPFVTVIKNGYSDWRKYNARSSRREFWLWTLHIFLIFLIMGLFANQADGAGGGVEAVIAVLGWILIVPSIAMWVRRIHDSGHRIWWCFIPGVGFFINLWFLLSPTDFKENRWSRTTNERHLSKAEQHLRGYFSGMTFRRASLLLLSAGSFVFLVALVWLIDAHQVITNGDPRRGFCRVQGGREPCPSRVFPLALTIVGGATALVGLVSLMFSLNQHEKNPRT